MGLKRLLLLSATLLAIGGCDGIEVVPPGDAGGDTGMGDGGHDAGLDAGDATLPDTGLPDTGLPDTGLPDTGLPDTGLPDTGLPDTGLPDTGLPDTGLPPDSGAPADAGVDSGADAGTPGMDSGTDSGTDAGPAILCGNGVQEGTEACDDDNMMDTDGCSMGCTIEPGYLCTGGLGMLSSCSRLPVVEMGGEHGCMLLEGEGVFCWGDNSAGEVSGSAFDVGEPVAVTGIGTAISICTGENHSCALNTTGQVFCWGDNASEELGSVQARGTDSNTPVDTAIDMTVTGAARLFCGYDHVCVIDGSGNLSCWGDDDNEQLGPNALDTFNNGDTGTPVAVPLAGVPSAVGLGGDHSCAVVGGAVFCWGNNDNGQLGNGASGADSDMPVEAMGVSGVTQVAAGENHTCAIGTGDAVFCWGDDDVGQLGIGGLGDQNTPTAVALPGPATNITANENSTCAIVGGDAFCWGEGNDGKLGAASSSPADSNVPVAVLMPPAVSFVSIDLGQDGACAISDTGRRWCWGAWGVGAAVEEGELGIGPHNAFTPQPVSLPMPALSISANGAEYRGNVCAVLMDRSVMCWGGETQVMSVIGGSQFQPLPTAVPGLANIRQVASGNNFGCALEMTGGVRCWGDNGQRQLGRGAAAGTSDDPMPAAVMGISTAEEIAVGGQFACARLMDGTVQCWGDSSDRQLGLDGTADADTPQTIPVVTGATSICAGADFACAVAGDQTVRCWGDNDNNQLGNNTGTTDSFTPVTATGVAGATQVVCGAAFACALIGGTNTVTCWGDNGRGQVGDGMSPTDRGVPAAIPGLANVASLSSNGGDFTCANRMDGTVTCWGSGLDGQLGNGGADDFDTPQPFPTAVGVNQVATGDSVTCLLSSGNVSCLGDRNRGQIGDGTAISALTPVRARLP